LSSFPAIDYSTDDDDDDDDDDKKIIIIRSITADERLTAEHTIGIRMQNALEV
jgi:hypothetical protein